MSLTLLDIQHLRNLEEVRAEFASKFNLIYGDNGSGKTSLLEAIHYLVLGRSFRTRLNSRIVYHEADCFRLFGHIQKADQAWLVGIERYANGDGRLRINEQNAKSFIEITQALPVRLLYTDSRLLLTGTSKLRRQFIDWGVFHVEPTFITYWQHVQRALKQRNAALRSRAAKALIQLWDDELDKATHTLNTMRRGYIEGFEAVFKMIVQELLPDIPISIAYKPGWNEEIGLKHVLEQSLARDLELGYTQYGPQRADLLIRVNKTIPAQDKLSQGQQKLLVYALYLAQGVFLKQQLGRSCVYLLDDLPAELDQHNRQRVLKMLETIDAQVFVTGVNREDLMAFNYSSENKMFHVERGRVLEAAL